MTKSHERQELRPQILSVWFSWWGFQSDPSNPCTLLH